MYNENFTYSNFINYFPGMVVVKEADTGRFIDFNNRFLEHFGFTDRQQCYGKTNEELFDLHLAKKLNDLDKKIINRESEGRYVHESTMPGGEHLVFGITGNKFKDENNKDLLVIFVYDITKEMTKVSKMEGELENAKYYTAIAELTEDYDSIDYVDLYSPKDDNVIVYRTESAFSEVLPEWQKEKSGERRMAIMIENIVYEPDKYRVYKETAMEHVLQVLSDQTAYYVNFRVILNGEISYYQIKYTRNLDDRGNIVGFICGIHNISEWVRQESEKEEQLSIIASMSDDFEFLGIINSETDEMTVYRASQRIKNVISDLDSETSEMGKYVTYIKRSILPEEEEYYSIKADKATVMEKLKYASSYKFDTRFVVEGETVHYRIKYTRGLKNPNMVVVGHLNINNQIQKENAMLRMERELEYKKEIEKARDTAEAANKAKSEFLFNMSHDIRTPMNAITGFTSIAKKHIDNKDRVEDCLNKIDSSSEHLLRLINEILDMSRIESGNIVIEEKAVSIHELFDISYSMCNEIALAKDIKLTLEKREIYDDKVYADELHVNQIVMNVLSNAIKYTDRGGVVRCTVRQEARLNNEFAQYKIVVDDTGIGMSPEFLKTIYDAFSRERNSTISGIEGTGLGMAIVKKLVDLLDGSINIKSKVGVGTRVEITLPFRIVSDDIDKKERLESFKRKSLRGKRVLLVEDNELNREIAKDVLEEEGMIVEEANDGDEAVSHIKDKMLENPFYFDFVLMDIQMPKMDGYEAAKQIRRLPMSRYVHVPIIAMTANAFEEDRKRAMAAGMDAHLAKPVDIEVLLDTLSRF